MPFIILAVITIGFFIIFPKGAKYLLAVPLFGLCMGGFFWSLSAMIGPALGLFTTDQFVTFYSFGMYVLFATLLSLILATQVD